MQIYFHSRLCSYLSRVPILVEGTIYIYIYIYIYIHIYIYIYTVYTGASQKFRIWWKSSFFSCNLIQKVKLSYFRFITCRVKHFKSFLF